MFFVPLNEDQTPGFLAKAHPRLLLLLWVEGQAEIEGPLLPQEEDFFSLLVSPLLFSSVHFSSLFIFIL